MQELRLISKSLTNPIPYGVIVKELPDSFQQLNPNFKEISFFNNHDYLDWITDNLISTSKEWVVKQVEHILQFPETIFRKGASLLAPTKYYLKKYIPDVNDNNIIISPRGLFETNAFTKRTEAICDNFTKFFPTFVAPIVLNKDNDEFISWLLEHSIPETYEWIVIQLSKLSTEFGLSYVISNLKRLCTDKTMCLELGRLLISGSKQRQIEIGRASCRERV